MNGLTSIQAAQLLNQYGPNVIAEQKKKSIIIKFLEQFNNFLAILLIFAAVISFFIGEPVDGGLILAIVILNAIFGFYQEAKAEEAIAALKKMTITKIRVLRDAQQQEIDSRYLVQGDVIFIEEGTKIPADAWVTESIGLQINEAALTGESLPVAKDQKDKIFSGTVVATGRGQAKIMATGMATKFGEIAKNLSLIIEEETPLQKKLKELTRLIGVIGVIAAIAVFLISFIKNTGYLPAGRQVFPAFLLAVSLAVAVVPEGLPAVMTITLSIGMKAMAKKKSIIRKLSAIEGLGNVTLIATDKTGTLTENKMKVKEIWIDGKTIFKKIEGRNASKLIETNRNLLSSLDLLILNGILCSTASLVYVLDHGRYDVLGDPTEGALLYLAQNSGFNIDEVREEWKTIFEKSFDSLTRMMTVVVSRRGESFVFSKGAPEAIIDVCNKILINGKEAQLTMIEKEKIEKQVEAWARRGLRVLGFAYEKDSSTKIFSQVNSSSHNKQSSSSNIHSQKNFVSSSFINKNMIFLGLVAIHDAPRPEVVTAVKKAKEAGIKAVMITGDNEKTAEAVGVMTGLIKWGDEIIVGEQVDKYSDEELLSILKRVKIFARTNPLQKYRITKLYQRLGEVVAVTGDGVNDAVALKQADVGVAMGLVGTDVARETADMVITDDNFASIVTAVEEGRNIIKNLKNAIEYLLSCNITEAMSLIAGLFLGLPTLFYPIQLLYINLVTDGLPALALAFSPKDASIMREKVRRKLTLIENHSKKYIFFVGLLGAAIIIFAFLIYGKTLGGGYGKTAAFSILTLMQSFILIDQWLSHKPLHKNLTALLSPIFIIAFSLPFIFQFVIVHLPTTASIFRVAPVNFFLYLQFIFFAGLVWVGIKIGRKLGWL